MTTGFTKQIRVRLKVYSDMVGKNKLEALYDALGIAKTVREKGFDLKCICALIEKEKEAINIRTFFRTQSQRCADYYALHSEELRRQSKENKLRKVV